MGAIPRKLFPPSFSRGNLSLERLGIRIGTPGMAQIGRASHSHPSCKVSAFPCSDLRRTHFSLAGMRLQVVSHPLLQAVSAEHQVISRRQTRFASPGFPCRLEQAAVVAFSESVQTKTGESTGFFQKRPSCTPLKEPIYIPNVPWMRRNCSRSDSASSRLTGSGRRLSAGVLFTQATGLTGCLGHGRIWVWL